jgi:hypothetical protein
VRQGDAWEALVREELMRARRRSRRSKVRTTPAPDLTADQPTTTTPTPPSPA